MRQHDDMCRWIHSQLTLTKWYLDAASHAATESVHQHIERARHEYNQALRVVAEAQRSRAQAEAAA